MTPLEIADYKANWMYDASYTAWIEPALWHDCQSFCKDNFEKHQWASKRHMRQDDAHWFLFELKEDYDKFCETFHTLDDWNYTNI